MTETPQFTKGPMISHGATMGAGKDKSDLNAGLSTVEESCKLQLKQAANPQDPQSSTVWTYNIPSFMAGQKKVLLQIVSGQLVILNMPSTDFPEEMYLIADQVSGFTDNDHNPTNIVAIFRISQLIPCVIANMVTYTIIYSCNEPLNWDMGAARTLTLSVGDINGRYIPPLPQTVAVQFKLIHVAY